jgi:hypothetical protein
MMLTFKHQSFENSTLKKKNDLIPDFLVIGGGKSGTTSLNMYLKQHPEIFMPAVKEPNFYGYENKTPDDFGGDLEEIAYFKNSITDLAKYLDLFRNAAPGQIKGEISNTYMHHDQAPMRIKHYNPAMKLIAILRQPAERLFSRYLHLARENRLPTSNFSDCRNKDSVWWKRNDLIKEGFYFKNLSRYYQLFPRQNIKIYLYEELNNDARQVLKDIFTFLNVNPNFNPDSRIHYNKSGLIKNQFLNKIYGQKGLISSGVKAVFPKSIVSNLKGNAFIRSTINYLRQQNLKRPKPDPAVLNWLTHEVYEADIKNLQELIGKNLEHWLAF